MSEYFDPRTDLPDGGELILMHGYQAWIPLAPDIKCRYCNRRFIAGDLYWRETPKKFVHQLVPELPGIRSCDYLYEVDTAICIGKKTMYLDD